MRFTQQFEEKISNSLSRAPSAEQLLSLSHGTHRQAAARSSAGLHAVMGRPMFGGAYLLPEHQRSTLPPRNAGGDARKLLKKESTTAARENEMLFQLADREGDGLTYEEFVSMVGARLPHLVPPPKVAAADGKQQQQDPKDVKERQLRRWFGALDRHGDGNVSNTEFYAFALCESIHRTGFEQADAAAKMSRGDPFQKDLFAFAILLRNAAANGAASTGSSPKPIPSLVPAPPKFVKREPFVELASKLGFGFDVGEALFDDVDKVELAFMLRLLHKRMEPLRPLIMEWVSKGVSGSAAAVGPTAAPDTAVADGGKTVARLDDATLRELEGARGVRGEGGVHAVLRRLRTALRTDVARVQAVFCAMDDDGSYAIGVKEFARGLEEMGLRSSMQLSTAIFDELDDDGSYQLTFDEFKTWLFASDEAFEQQLKDD